MLESLETAWERDSEVFLMVLVVAVTAFLVTRWARRSVRGGRQRQALRRAAVVLGVGGLAVAGVALARSGDDADREYAEKRMQQRAAEEKELRDRIAAAVRARRLPPAALEMFPADRDHHADIIPRPEGNGDRDDVIHVGGDGTRGRKLAWDLDDSGGISRDEREITELELWAAAIAVGRPFDGFGPDRRREDSGPREPA